MDLGLARYGYLSAAEEIAMHHKQALPSDRLQDLNPGCGFVMRADSGRQRPPEKGLPLSLHYDVCYLF